MEINTEVEVGGSLLQVGPGQKPQDLIQKTTKAKGGWECDSSGRAPA
jgi:hypothetical protein